MFFIDEILVKVATLNKFYSTNILKVYPIAKHILDMNIDERLKIGDAKLVNELAKNIIIDKTINLYSFATKYCSHHYPLLYPIFDDYVADCLLYFNKINGFFQYKLQKIDLKNYEKFREVVFKFRDFYDLNRYSIKQIDKYLWLLEKEYFPKKYYNKQKKSKETTV